MSSDEEMEKQGQAFVAAMHGGGGQARKRMPFNSNRLHICNTIMSCHFCAMCMCVLEMCADIGPAGPVTPVRKNKQQGTRWTSS